MPELGLLAVAVGAVFVLFCVAWCCLMNRKHYHTQPFDVSRLIANKMWIGNNPIEEALRPAQYEDPATRRRREAEERMKAEAREAEKRKDKARLLLRAANNYCRSLRAERKLLNVEAFFGKLFVLHAVHRWRLVICAVFTNLDIHNLIYITTYFNELSCFTSLLLLCHFFPC